MERKKRSKGSLWEFCYANKIFGTFGDEIKANGQKLVKFCAHTHAAKLVVEIRRYETPTKSTIWQNKTLQTTMTLRASTRARATSNAAVDRETSHARTSSQ